MWFVLCMQKASSTAATADLFHIISSNEMEGGERAGGRVKRDEKERGKRVEKGGGREKKQKEEGENERLDDMGGRKKGTKEKRQ